MTITQYVNLSSQIFGCVLTAIIITCLQLSRNTNLKRTKTLTLFLLFNAGVMLFDAFALYFRGGETLVDFYGVRIANCLGFCCGALVPTVFLIYMACGFKNPEKISKMPLRISMLSCVVYLVAYTVNFFLPVFYRIDVHNIYHRMPLYPLTFIPVFLNVGLAFYLLIRYKNQMERTNRILYMLYFILPLPVFAVQMFVYGLNLVNFVGMIFIIVIFLFIEAEQGKKMAMQETEVLSSRIDIALSQIQPHFLYNSLTSIYRLCDVKSDSAKEAISNFSKYLRGNLDSIKNAKMITFADELEHIKAYVYKKPKTTTTATTLSLTNLDDRCKYFIDGIEGERRDTDGDGEDDTVVFTGLTPNTDYTVTVKGQADDGETTLAYAYVYDKTKPAYVGTMNVYLHTVSDPTGSLADITDILEADAALAYRLDGDVANIEMLRTSEGVYTATLSAGTFYPWYSTDGENWLRDNQQVIITNSNKTNRMDFYTVEYDANDGEGAPSAETYHFGDTVKVSNTEPTREGYAFAGWKINGSETVYKAGETITSGIEKPYKLVAQWDKTNDIYVHFEIDHYDKNKLGTDGDDHRENVPFTLDGRVKGYTGDYTQFYSTTLHYDSDTAPAGYEVETEFEKGKTDITRYIAKEPTFKDALSSMEYTVAVAKTGYSIVENGITTETKENGDIHITVKLIYDPNNFDFTFDVELDNKAKQLPDTIKPKAVNVKVMSFFNHPDDEINDHKWYTITQHRNVYVQVPLDENGEGSGTYPVWIAHHDNNKEYYYRIEVVSYVLPDGTTMAATDVDEKHETYETADKRYSAEIVTSNDCVSPAAGQLPGAYWVKANKKQIGTVTAVVSIEVFDVTFKPNGGTLNGGTEDIVVKEQVAVPNLSDYVPTREGGYIFDGWYLADKNGVITDKKVSSGEALYSNITLIAKWKEPLTVSGYITVAGTYSLDGGTTFQTIHDEDRAKSLTVALQRVNYKDDTTIYYSNKASQTITITYPENANPDEGIGSYNFSGIPDDGAEYRISVVTINYYELFRNENTDGDEYNESDYGAVFGNDDKSTANKDESKIANVDAYLIFTPSLFPLKYSIDATAIGENYRPNKAEALVLYYDGKNGDIKNPQTWTVISQMEKSEGGNISLISQSTTLTNGEGDNSYPVWVRTPNDALYDYSVLLYKYGDGEKLSDTTPFTVTYNGSARYDSTNDLGQTQMLTIELTPNTYDVIFNLKTTDTVTGMDEYKNGDTYSTTHTWSFDTQINATPKRVGYDFLGWFVDSDKDGIKGDGEDYVEKIAADVSEDTILTADWKKSVYKVTWVDGNGKTLKTDEVEYGEMPVYEGDTPTKTATDEFTYTFNKTWSPNVVAVKKDAIYTAQFDSVTNKYKVTWVDGNGKTLKTDEVEYGKKPVYEGDTPTKTATDEFTYTFNNTWSPEVDDVTKDVTYTAQFDSVTNKYKVTWVDGDGKILKTNEVEYGKKPVYEGDTPTKTATAQFTYTFNNKWSPEIVAVTKDATYTAQFDSIINKYQITWVDDDGKTLKVDEVEYGKKPVYEGNTPTKTSDEQYTYTFAGWIAEISPVTGDVTYTATYKKTDFTIRSPKTGDNFNINIWFALLLVSGAGLAGTSLCRRKKKEQAE